MVFVLCACVRARKWPRLSVLHPVPRRLLAMMAVLSDMPDLVLLRIVDFLGPEDTTKLGMTCRRLEDLLPKFLVMRGPDFSVPGKGVHLEHVELYFNGPRLHTAVQRLDVSVRGWNDQRWGNRKGALFVRLMRRNVEEEGSEEIIAEKREIFGIAEHTRTSAKLLVTRSEAVVDKARAGDWYRFMRRAGGGGGHTLDVVGFRAVAMLR